MPDENNPGRKLAAYGALIGALLLLAALIFQSVNRSPRQITDTYGDATVAFTVNPGVVAFPNETVEVSWETINNREVYFNGEGKVGIDSREVVVDRCSDRHLLRVVFHDGSQTVYELRSMIWSLDETTWFLGSGVVALVLLAGHFMPLPLVSGVSRRFFGLLQWREDSEGNSVFLLRALSLISAVLLLFYAITPFCDQQTILSFFGAHTFNVIIYILSIVVSFILFVLSLLMPQETRHCARAIFAVTPFWLLFGIVLAGWYGLFLLVAFWGLGLPAVNVFPLLVWIGAIGFLVLAIGQRHAGIRKHRDLSLSLHPLLRRYGVFLFMLIVWIILWKAPWQGILGHWWLRSLIGMAVYLLPGILFQQFFYMNKPLNPVRAMTVGFCASLGLIGLIGFVARVTQLSSTTVMNSVFWLGVLLIILLAARWKPALISVKEQSLEDAANKSAHDSAISRLAMTLIGLAALLLISRLPFSYMNYQTLNSDYRTYNGYVTVFSDSDRYDFNDAFMNMGRLSSSRDWLAFWPLGQAVMAHVTGTHTRINFLILGAWIAILAMMSVYGLARALRFSQSLAWLAVVASVMSLVFTLESHEAGFSFFERIHQDKVVAAFIFAPVFFRVVIEHNRKPARKNVILLSLISLGLLFTHPTALMMISIITFITFALDVIITRQWRWHFIILLILGVCLVPPAYFRLFHFAHTVYTLEGLDEKFVGDIPIHYIEPIYIVEGTSFYGVSPALLDGVAFGLVYLAGAIAISRFRKDQAARFILANMIAIALTIFPISAFLLGLAISATQIWRFPWLTPFGVAIAFLVLFAQEKIIPDRHKLRPAFVPMIGLLLSGMTLFELQNHAWVREDLEAIRNWQGDAPIEKAETLVKMAREFDAYFTEPTILLGDPHMIDQIPNLSAKTKSFTYRKRGPNGEHDAYLEFYQTNDPERRLEILGEYNLEYLLIRGENQAMTELREAYPDHFELVLYVPPYQLYRYRK